MRQIDRAKAMTRDLDEPLDVHELALILEQLDEYPAPHALTSAENLLALVRPHLPAPAPRRFRTEGLAASASVTVLRYCAAQVWLFRPGWWLGTLAATVAGLALVREISLAPGLVAPPLVAVSLAYSFREAGTPAWEMELSCPVQPYQVMLARVAVILAWVTALGAAFLGLGGFGDWLAGMLLFTGISLLAVVLTGPRLGAALGLLGWLFFAVRNAEAATAWGVPNAAAAAAGAACLALALMLAHRMRRPGRREG